MSVGVLTHACDCKQAGCQQACLHMHVSVSMSCSYSRFLTPSLAYRLSPQGFGTKLKYTTAWRARAWLLAAMAREGVKQLTGTRQVTWTDFAESFPDSGGWFARLVARGQHYKSLYDYLRDLSYQGRPEFFSAHACLLLGKSMRVNPKWMLEHGKDLQDFRASYRRIHHIDMVPGRVVNAIRCGHDASLA